jgi:hypothetical protein
MFEKFEKDPDLDSEKTTTIPKAPSNSINASELLASLQKMKTEEQVLLEQKQRLLEAEQTLHSKLVKEMDKKKNDINNLKTEILHIANTCKELSQALEAPKSMTGPA